MWEPQGQGLSYINFCISRVCHSDTILPFSQWIWGEGGHKRGGAVKKQGLTIIFFIFWSLWSRINITLNKSWLNNFTHRPYISNLPTPTPRASYLASSYLSVQVSPHPKGPKPFPIPVLSPSTPHPSPIRKTLTWCRVISMQYIT